MKQKDFALIIAVVFISAIVSYFLSNMLFASPKNRQQQAEVVQPITADFQTPSKKYFNENAFDPIKQINIGQNDNADPFKSDTP